MEIVIGIIVGFAIGFFVGKLMEAKKAGEEKTQLIAQNQVLQANIEQANQHHASETQSLKESHISEIQGLKDSHISEIQSLKAQMENERLFAEKLRAESDQQWAQKLESLKQEMLFLLEEFHRSLEGTLQFLLIHLVLGLALFYRFFEIGKLLLDRFQEFIHLESVFFLEG